MTCGMHPPRHALRHPSDITQNSRDMTTRHPHPIGHPGIDGQPPIGQPQQPPPGQSTKKRNNLLVSKFRSKSKTIMSGEWG